MNTGFNYTKHPAHPTTPQKNKSPMPIPVRHHGPAESFEMPVKLSPRRCVVIVVRVIVAVQVEAPVAKVWVVVMVEVITAVAKEEKHVGGMIDWVVGDGKAWAGFEVGKV